MLLQDGAAYAKVLDDAGSLRHYVEIEGVDHCYNFGYGGTKLKIVEEVYQMIVRYVQDAVAAEGGSTLSTGIERWDEGSLALSGLYTAKVFLFDHQNKNSSSQTMSKLSSPWSYG